MDRDFTKSSLCRRGGVRHIWAATVQNWFEFQMKMVQKMDPILAKTDWKKIASKRVFWGYFSRGFSKNGHFSRFWDVENRQKPGFRDFDFGDFGIFRILAIFTDFGIPDGFHQNVAVPARKAQRPSHKRTYYKAQNRITRSRRKPKGQDTIFTGPNRTLQIGYIP